MSNYGLNFGFRRSEPSVREGRLRVPAAGTFYQGDLVTYDPAAPGFLKHAAADAAPQAGFTGLLIQEEGWDIGHFEAPMTDSHSLGKVRNSAPAVIQTGPGNKVWIRNTAAQTRYDGRVIAARTPVVLAGVVVGDYLAWTGTAWAETAVVASAALRVVEVGTDYLEALLLA